MDTVLREGTQKSKLMPCNRIIADQAKEKEIEILEKPKLWWHVSPILILTFCLMFRIFTVMMMSTTFVPDEYYQSVEVAYEWVFDGRGIVTWEWFEEHRIRSWVYVLPYIGLFQVGKLLNINAASWAGAYFSTGPRLLTAIITAFGDVMLFLLAKRIASRSQTMNVGSGSGKKSTNLNTTSQLTAITTLLIYLSFWSVMYMCTRTLANSFENFALIFVWYYWEHSARRRMSMSVSHDGDYGVAEITRSYYEKIAIGAMVISTWARPTAACFYFTLIIARIKVCGFSRLVTNIFFTVLSTLALCTCVDMYFYDADKPLCPSFNFLYKNIYLGYSSLFGVTPHTWNVYEGLPSMLGPWLPLATYYFLLELMAYDSQGGHLESISKKYNVHSPIRHYLYSVLFAVTIQSVCSKHHEMRFLLPTMPAWALLIGQAVGFEVGFLYKLHQLSNITKAKRTVWFAVISALLSIGMAIYLLTLHQNGTETAFHFIRKYLSNKKLDYSVRGGVLQEVNIHLIAPCHSFPGYSFIHTPSRSQYNSGIDYYSTRQGQGQGRGRASFDPRIHMFHCTPTLSSEETTKGAGMLTMSNSVSAQFEKDPAQVITWHFNNNTMRVSSPSNDPQKKKKNQKMIGMKISIDIIVTFDAYQRYVEDTFVHFNSSGIDCGHKGEYCLSLKSKSNKHPLRLLKRLHHADTRYDYNDKYQKKEVLIYSRV